MTQQLSKKRTDKILITILNFFIEEEKTKFSYAEIIKICVYHDIFDKSAQKRIMQISQEMGILINAGAFYEINIKLPEAIVLIQRLINEN